MRIRNEEVEISTLEVGARFRFSGQADIDRVWEVRSKGPRGHVGVIGRPGNYPPNLMVVEVLGTGEAS